APNAQYVQLQMYNAGQNFVGGFTVAVFDASDTLVNSYTFPDVVGPDVPNGVAYSKILIATPEAETLFGVTADLPMTASIPLAGGAVCFGGLPNFWFDCFTWGNWVDAAGGADPSGTNYRAATGLTQ